MNRFRATALLEVLAMATLVLSYIWLWEGSFPGDFVVVVGLYFGIGILSHVRRGESARELGFRLDNLRPALRNVFPVAATGSGASLAAGMTIGGWPAQAAAELTAAGAVAAAGLLLAWTTAQQYGLVCFFYRRLGEVLGSPQSAALGAATLFALFHLPNAFLMGVTLLAGWVACMLYRREPNVLVLGVAHALISAILSATLPESITHGLRVGPGYLTAD